MNVCRFDYENWTTPHQKAVFKPKEWDRQGLYRPAHQLCQDTDPIDVNGLSSISRILDTNAMEGCDILWGDKVGQPSERSFMRVSSMVLQCYLRIGSPAPSSIWWTKCATWCIPSAKNQKSSINKWFVDTSVNVYLSLPSLLLIILPYVSLHLFISAGNCASVFSVWS